MIREINFPLSFIGHRVRKGVCVCVCVWVCVCVCVCAHARNCIQPSRDTKFLWPWVRWLWNWLSGRTSGIDKKKANAWFDLEVETKHILPRHAHPQPWFQVTGGKKDTLREPTSVGEFLESHSPSCSRQPVIDTKNCTHTGQSSLVLFLFLDVRVDGREQQRELRVKTKH